MTSLPFDGEISRFFREDAPEEVREAITSAKKKRVLDPSYPYDRKMDTDSYDAAMAELQIELVKLQSHLTESGARICLVFEGRDAAGKGGTIRRITQNLNARVANTVALSKPNDSEKTQWYFQRYLKHLPSAGRMTLFDRSWYNRGVVEKVFGFCEPAERALFFKQAPHVERMLVEDGIIVIKFWLNVGRAEQLKRILAREADPLKQWKLSWIDVEGLKHWDAYTDAISETFDQTHSSDAPWTVIRSDDKKRARLAAIQTVLSSIDYPGKDTAVVGTPDPKICGGPDIWHA